VPKYFKTIVIAAKQLSSYNETENSYIPPIYSIEIRVYNPAMCRYYVMSINYLRFKLTYKIEEIKNYVTVFQKQWKFSVSSNTCQDLSKKKFNTTTGFHSIKDITTLHDYLLNQIQNVTNLIEKQKQVNQDTYKILCKTLLTQIILLNRRISEEVERITSHRLFKQR